MLLDARHAQMRRSSNSPVILIGTVFLFASSVGAHGDHGHGGFKPSDPSLPIDTMLWMHMFLQGVVWLGLFPLAMVLGLTRSTWHVPLSLTSLVLTSGGYILGSQPRGKTSRGFPHTAHGTFASFLIWYMILQALMGTYLKLHLRLGEKRVRPVIVRIHGAFGTAFTVIGFVQSVLGVITLRNWCFGGHLGQCLAHGIMGGAFIAYGILFLIFLKAGALWLRRRNISQEFLDSCVITAWGLVNTFTEHHGGPWTHKDLQHTLLGVAWFTAGAAGIWTSRNGKRSVLPAVVIILTGWAMSGHAQALMLSTMVHALFGWTLMAAGLARIIEVCFVLKDRPSGGPAATSSDGVRGSDASETAEELEHQQRISLGHPPGQSGWFEIKAWQYLPIYLLMSAGVLFMSATDEELHWANDQGVDHITWGLIDFSIASIFFLWANVLVDLYTSSGGRRGMARRHALTNASGPNAYSGHVELGSSRGYERLARSSASAPRRGRSVQGQDATTGASAARRSEDSASFEMGLVHADSAGRAATAKARQAKAADAGVSSGSSVSDDQPHHVLFDHEAGDDDADPFDDEDVHRR